MNKIIFLKQKVLVAISIVLYISLFSSFAINTNGDSDYNLLNKIIERVNNKNSNKSIILNESNNNEVVISIINELNSLEMSGNKVKLDSLKSEIGIEKNAKFNSIFNKKEYLHLISQKNNSKWDFDKITVSNITFSQKNIKATNTLALYISKPIYTKNNKFALVYSNNEKTSKIIVFEKTRNGWEEYKIIVPMIIARKVSVEKK